jgi:hypothetical protein
MTTTQISMVFICFTHFFFFFLKRGKNLKIKKSLFKKIELSLDTGLPMGPLNHASGHARALARACCAEALVEGRLPLAVSGVPAFLPVVPTFLRLFGSVLPSQKEKKTIKMLKGCLWPVYPSTPKKNARTWKHSSHKPSARFDRCGQLCVLQTGMRLKQSVQNLLVVKMLQPSASHSSTFQQKTTKMSKLSFVGNVTQKISVTNHVRVLVARGVALWRVVGATLDPAPRLQIKKSGEN